MMRGAERAAALKRVFSADQICHAVDARYFECFRQRERWQNAGHRARQQRLADSGGSLHQYIVIAARRNFEGALDVLLPLDIREIDRAFER